MDLIERYLHAVKGHLPLKHQDDVVAELGEDVRSRIDERESELGRPLDESEVAAVLKSLGHPAILAAGYGPWQRLIGPALFPMYVYILKMALGISLLVNVVLSAVLFATGHSATDSLRGLITFPFVTAMLVFGWVTIVFAIIDAKAGPATLSEAVTGHKALFANWDPRALPAVPRHPRTVPFWQVVLDLAGAMFFLAWWLAVPSNPFLMFGPGAALLSPGPGLLASYVPVACLGGVAVVARGLAVWQPHLRSLLSLICRVLGVLGVAIVWWNGGPYVVPAMANPPADLVKAMIWIDRTVLVSLVVVTVITVGDLIKDVWRRQRSRRLASAAAAASTPPGSPR
jgi:hypothetical protein